MTPTPQAIARLKNDFRHLQKEPIPFLEASPLESNILEWRYCIHGAPDTPYEGGYYHGKLVFPANYPFRPPSIYMITPNGRFKVNSRLCLSISDFHPDTWNPCWHVGTIVTGLISFMNDTSQTWGSITTSLEEKRNFAKKSLMFNASDKTFCELFPETTKNIKNKLKVIMDTNPELFKAITQPADKNPTPSGGSKGEENSGWTIVIITVGIIILSIMVTAVVKNL
uniref:UBIQUITIN_CONJUGAT_2 domain-containing protein n=1 Tax=Rhabditophanes sp. KR3021 TaxID=114890 RepID=A0AC35TLM3_9BILA